jgi:protease-4
MENNNLQTIIYLKEKLHKWKNIAILAFITVALSFIKIMTGDTLSDGVSIDGRDYIANLKIEGIIFEDDYRSKILEKIKSESSIKGVVIEINSPGGSIVGSEILFEELRNIAQKKPTVVVMNSLAASGGYMAAIASDHIIARNGSLTGSIGVLMESSEVTELANKIGVKLKTYKSSPLKGSPSPFEKSTAKVDEVIQESILDSYEFFSKLVLERRAGKLDKSSIYRVFDGRVFTGRQALKAGLVDEIGGKAEAITYLAKNKVDSKLPVKEILLAKEKNDILDKIFSMLPDAFHSTLSRSNSHKIMALMPM